MIALCEWIEEDISVRLLFIFNVSAKIADFSNSQKDQFFKNSEPHKSEEHKDAYFKVFELMNKCGLDRVQELYENLQPKSIHFEARC